MSQEPEASAKVYKSMNSTANRTPNVDADFLIFFCKFFEVLQESESRTI